VSPRERFLTTVRRAVAEGNRAGTAPALEPRGGVGYQSAGGDLVARFCAELQAAGGRATVVPDRAGVVAALLPVVQAKAAPRVLLGGGLPAELRLQEPLQASGIEVISVADLSPEASRSAFFHAELGVTGVDYLIAETGSLALLTSPGQPRSLSLLPPVHVAIARSTQILPDLFDLFEASRWANEPGLPPCLTLITGPSKTGDIELKLVTGVHGPGEVHVIILG
jgi:L-lactate utilization protein LutC